MGSFSIPLSGLTAAQDQLQSVSNNLSNINTDGYKDENVLFSDLFAQAGGINGAGDPMQSGLGVVPCATMSNFTDGTQNPTGIASNMALSGNGFFVVQASTAVNQYTRAGDFIANNAGYLTTPEGDLVMGYPAANGVVNTSAPLQPLQVGTGVTTPAVATSSVQITANLDSNTAVGGSGPTSTLEVYDSLGSQHELTVSYTMTAANTWNYTVTVPSADLAAGGTGNTVVGSGTLNFDGNGNLTSTANVTPISLPTLADGATAPQAITGPFGTASSPTITQTASDSTTSATSQNGYASGTLQSYAVESDGTILGTFSSGASLALGQVAVASFANNQGLTDVGSNNYQATAASGPAVIGTAGSGGRGTIVGGSVEESNVDIATEFSKLIVAQQAYSANAKSITTFNQISQATLQMLQ
jgi:flagellar hook protein FlgE